MASACITAEDTRWARCDIKSVALLANVLLRQLAVDANASETILLRDGELMEGSASTVHIVKDGVLITPLNSTRILPGTTRSVVEELADKLGIARRDARVSEAELRAADEIWLAAATREVQPVTQLDGTAGGQRQARPAVAPCLRRLPAAQARLGSFRPSGNAQQPRHWRAPLLVIILQRVRCPAYRGICRWPRRSMAFQPTGRRDPRSAATIGFEAFHHAEFGFQVAHHLRRC